MKQLRLCSLFFRWYESTFINYHTAFQTNGHRFSLSNQDLNIPDYITIIYFIIMYWHSEVCNVVICNTLLYIIHYRRVVAWLYLFKLMFRFQMPFIFFICTFPELFLMLKYILDYVCSLYLQNMRCILIHSFNYLNGS